MCGEHDFSGMLVERFAGYHRQSYGGCKVGNRGILIGAAAYPTRHRQRMLRLIEAMTLWAVAVGYLTESMHGAGSPQAQRMMAG